MRPAVPAVLLLALLSLSGCLRGGGGLLGDDGPDLPFDYLQGTYPVWYVEVDSVDGWEPGAGARDMLRERMMELAFKDEFRVTLDGALPSRETWDDEALLALHDERQGTKATDERVVTHVLFVDGAYGENPDTLGITYGHDLVVIFHERIDTACEPSIDPADPTATPLPCLLAEEDIEAAVLVHEFGHAVGLVNRGLPMVEDHEDDEHPRHSPNTQSVMYWGVNSALAVGGMDSIPTRFDEDDRRDVCAAGGRC